MHDVVIIGGGHNGLVCSAYLAMAGFKVVVLDQRPVIGGAAVTEEFSPGFSNSVASYTVSLLNPKIIRDLDLAAHGLRIIERPISNFLPLEDGRFLKVGGGQTKQRSRNSRSGMRIVWAIIKHAWPPLPMSCAPAVLETPPNVVEGSPFAAIAELIKAGRIGNRIRALGLDLSGIFSISSRPPPAISSTAGLKARLSRPPSALTALSAIMRAPTRRARPMFSCTIALAR